MGTVPRAPTGTKTEHKFVLSVLSALKLKMMTSLATTKS
jgi:hypothetical protein